MSTAQRNGKANQVTEIQEVSNDGESQILLSEPMRIETTIEGSADILFHRYSVESVAEKAKAAKGSAAKKTDDIESYVYRNAAGELCIPGTYLHAAIIAAAKFQQDPRSPRKSAMDLYKAAVIPLTPLASLGVKDWDYIDQRGVRMNGGSRITRQRPAMRAGWQASFQFLITLPEYVDIRSFRQAVSEAGRLVGIGDFRPTYGRFQIVSCKQIVG